MDWQLARFTQPTGRYTMVALRLKLETVGLKLVYPNRYRMAEATPSVTSVMRG